MGCCYANFANTIIALFRPDPPMTSNTTVVNTAPPRDAGDGDIRPEEEEVIKPEEWEADKGDQEGQGMDNSMKAKLMRMAGGVSNFIQREWEDFETPWTWEVNSSFTPKFSKKGKKKGNSLFSFSEIMGLCRRSQYLLVGVAVLLTMSFEYSRRLFAFESVRNGVCLIVMEFLTFLVLSHFLGLRRFPAGYISLIMMKAFLILEKDLKHEVENFKSKVSPRIATGATSTSKEWLGRYSTFSFSFGMIFAKLVLYGALVPLLWKLEQTIDFTQHERTILTSTFAGTTSAAVLLFSSFAFENNPKFKELHWGFSELWVVLAVPLFGILLIFFFQHFLHSIRPQLKIRRGSMMVGRLLFEACIFIFALCIMLRYLPVIHRGFSVVDSLERKNDIILEHVVPPELWKLKKLWFD